MQGSCDPGGGHRVACDWRYTKLSLMDAPLCGTYVRVCAMYPFYFGSRVCMLPIFSGAWFSFSYALVGALYNTFRIGS